MVEKLDDLIDWLESEDQVQPEDFDKITTKDLSGWIDNLLAELKRMREGLPSLKLDFLVCMRLFQYDQAGLDFNTMSLHKRQLLKGSEVQLDLLKQLRDLEDEAAVPSLKYLPTQRLFVSTQGQVVFDFNAKAPSKKWLVTDLQRFAGEFEQGLTREDLNRIEAAVKTEKFGSEPLSLTLMENQLDLMISTACKDDS